ANVPTVISTFVLNRNGRNANRRRALTLPTVGASTRRSGSPAAAADVRWFATPCAKVVATEIVVASLPGKMGPPAATHSLNGTVKVKPFRLIVIVVNEID